MSFEDPFKAQAVGAQTQDPNSEDVFESIQSVAMPEGSNPRSPEKILITTKDGETREIDPNQVVKTIGEGEHALEITAGTAFHIYHLHVSGEVPGSKFNEGTTLSDVAKLIAEKFDLEAVASAQRNGSGPLLEHKFVGTIDTGNERFSTSVATLEQMLENGVITSEQLQDFNDNYRSIVEQSNREGNQDMQNQVMNDFNSKGYPMYLKQRFPGAPVTPFFDADSVQTSEMAIVAKDGQLVTTMTGHHREKLPFSPASTFEHIKESSNQAEYQRLLELFGSDEVIQEQIEKEFEINSADWLNAGFIERRG
jgi:hypothetical protein